MGESNPTRIIAVVTGSRAEFGLLRSTMHAIENHPLLRLEIIVTGTHLLASAGTAADVEGEFGQRIAARIPMQAEGETGRAADAAAMARGAAGFAARFAAHAPDVVLVLGDRIEAFAAAASAAVGGVRVAHMHGGDRAEGIADEALRHAITKLAHIHLPATASSAERIIAMGEEPLRVHLVGSPAIDGLSEIAPLDDKEYQSLGSPQIVFLLHPTDQVEDEEWANAERLLRLCQRMGPTLALHPNHDAGREGILRAIVESSVPHRAHLPRDQFIGLLRRAKVIVGNSSAGLIEAAALGVRCVNIGTRQMGREMPGNVIDVQEWDFGVIDAAIEQALLAPGRPVKHPYGAGQSGTKTADVLATFDPHHHSLSKRNTY